ncbi:hypothetical protein GUJ93_ZPchr0009g1265 [Zizania palustris]|uniref:VTT domain-containing protein n=1 Tax=Zizania palustris TaxID=103762 RepID=A0A8J5V8J4_ZIZPA|nr:hypothetical protein GUJ93_ZPchr0009g1265 [Zizania palustris]
MSSLSSRRKAASHGFLFIPAGQAIVASILFSSFLGSTSVASTSLFNFPLYFARERILKLVEGNKKFLAIDKAIGENGFKVVTLLRLSPLLPFSLGNYLYGLTSVKFLPYVLGRSHAIYKTKRIAKTIHLLRDQ